MKAIRALGALVLFAGLCIACWSCSCGENGATEPIPPEQARKYKCVNPECGKSFAETDLNLDETGQYGDAGVTGIKCPRCDQFSVFPTRRCEICGTVYVPTRASRGPEGDLACPQCGAGPGSAGKAKKKLPEDPYMIP